MKYLKKFFKFVFWLLLLAVLACLFFYFKFTPTKNPVWGLNFSPSMARYLGFNAVDLYGSILTDLKPAKVRLPAYWEDIEPEKGKLNFREIDELLNLSANAGTKVTLVVGLKQPRWPECHSPNWVKNLSKDMQRQELLRFLKQSVEHFKSFSAIERWQVENEPFFNFGPDCPVISQQDLKDEVLMVRQIDSRPIQTTDSGEKGGWHSAASEADVFGTTMYRTVYHSRFKRYITYPLPPAWYRIRAGIAQSFTDVKQVVGAELQAEPWFESDFFSTSIDKQVVLFSTKILEDNLNYAKATGLPEHYLWGVEWWYWAKDHGHPEYLEKIKNLIFN